MDAIRRFDRHIEAADRVATEVPSAKPRTLLRAQGIDAAFPVRRSLAEVLDRAPRRAVRAVQDLSLELHATETVGLVGESGSGKTTFARVLLGLVTPQAGRLEAEGRTLAPALADRRRDDLRRLQTVAQSPDDAFNPYRSIGGSLARPLVRLAGLGRREARSEVAELLRRVGLSSGYASRMPDQLSGGEKQRAAIARAFAADPAIVICDEATSSLDVSVQAMVLNLLRSLQAEFSGAYLFITHDLAVVAHLADRIAVMYLGRLMEHGRRDEVLSPPYHPYTEALLSSFPGLGRSDDVESAPLAGDVPSPVDVPGGCPFHTRCPRMLGPVCQLHAPPWREVGGEHRIYCHIPLDDLVRLQRPIFEDVRREDAR